MKKILSFLSATAAIAALAVSCEKEITETEPVTTEGNVVFEATAPGVATRTTIEDGTGNERIVKWAAGDEISIWTASEHTTAQAESAGTSSRFEATITPADTYYASYPSGVITSLSGSTPTISVPASQDGTFANANIAVATSPSSEMSLDFYNAVALVKFSVTGTDYTKAVFSGAKAETLAGSVPVTFGSSGITLGDVTSPATSVEVAISGAGTYYFAVLPVTLTNGFSITLYKGTTAETPAFVRGSKTLTTTTLLNLGSLDGKGVTDFFVTPSGAGKKSGKSWDNAMSVEELRTLIAQPVDGTSQIDAEAYYKAAILNGVTFHMAAGDYYLSGEAGKNVKVEFSGYSEQVQMTFLGGYPSGLTGTTTTGRDASTNISAFTGNSEAPILSLGNQTNVTFNGVTFKDALLASGSMAALYVSAGTSGNATLSMESCRFIANKQNSTSNTGAGLILGKCNATLSDCYFRDNYARNGSAVNLLQTTDGHVTMTDCIFEANKTYNTSGAVQNGGMTDVTITNCTFSNNNASVGYGGAFHSNGSAVTVLNNCSFTENSSVQGGAINVEAATVTCNNCTFTDNTASKGNNSISAGQDVTATAGYAAGGAISLINISASLTLNACTFSGNTAPNGSGGAIACTITPSDSGQAELIINAGTTFTGNRAYFNGGAILSMGGLTIAGTSASKVVFENNYTSVVNNQWGNGGAIWLNEGTTSTIDYALFDGNEAGQEDSNNIYYSNGGAISMKGVISLLVKNCEFTANRGRNGGCLNLELGGASTCKFTGCNFHDNICRSGANKDGSSGNFYGAVGRISYGTVQFEGCKFTGNIVKDNSAVLHMNGDTATAIFTNCEISDNQALSNHGCIKMEKATNRLYMSDCVFKNNKAASRGMINPTTGAIVYLNRVAFYNNETQNGGCWGVNIHSADANVCMNNVTSYGNHCKTDFGNRVSFNSDGGWLITNSTILDSTPTAAIRANGSRKVTLCNNIISNESTADNVFVLKSADLLNDYGHNLFSFTSAPSSPTLADTDLIGYSHSALGGSYSENLSTAPYYGVYIWANSLSGFTAATQADVEKAMKEGYPETDTNHSSITNIGEDFYNWLVGLNTANTSVDGRSIARSTPWWPGAYQN